jgi:hypothetical protein
MILTEQDIINWYQEKRNAWRRDKQAILEGKMRPEDTSLFHRFDFPKGQIDFSKVEAALERDDDSSWIWD